MNETATYNETIIVATLVIATNYFFRCYMYQFFATQATIIYNGTYSWRYRWAIATIK